MSSSGGRQVPVMVGRPPKPPGRGVRASAIVAGMASLVRHVTIDSADAYTLASWWAQALDGSLADDDFPGDPMASLSCSNGVQLLFITGPDRKTVKNRIHFDLQPQDRSRDAEVERLLAL